MYAPPPMGQMPRELPFFSLIRDNCSSFSLKLLNNICSRPLLAHILLRQMVVLRVHRCRPPLSRHTHIHTIIKVLSVRGCSRSLITYNVLFELTFDRFTVQHAVPYQMMMPPPGGPGAPPMQYEGAPTPQVQMGGHA